MIIEPVSDVVAGLGESPVWDPGTKSLSWVDVPGGMLHRTWPSTGITESRLVGGPLALALPLADGTVLVARQDDLVLLSPSSERVVASFPHRENMRLNDGLWDSGGRLIVGTMVLPQKEGGPATLWRVSPDGSRVPLVEGIRLSNGVGWSPDGLLYHVDTPARRIWAHGDSFARSAVFAKVEPGVGNPDGLTVDEDGCVWVCLFGGGLIRRYTPAGAIDKEVRLPVQHPTSCAFAGTELFVTTASNRLTSREERAAQPYAGKLLAFDAGVRGYPGALGQPPASWEA